MRPATSGSAASEIGEKHPEVKTWRPATVPWKTPEAKATFSASQTPPSTSHAAEGAAPKWIELPTLIRASVAEKGTNEDTKPTVSAQSMEERWDAFQHQLQVGETAFRTTQELVTRQNTDATAHQKEIVAYQESHNALSALQQQRLDLLTRECSQLRQSEASMKEVVAHQAERLAALEGELQSARVQLSEARLSLAQHINECHRLQQSCSTYEMHVRSLQASLHFADEVVCSMRRTVGACEQEKNDALMGQYTKFEVYRNDLVAFYDKRAAELQDKFALEVEKLHSSMMEAVAEREEQLKISWHDTAEKLRHEYDEVVALGKQRKAAMDTELRERREQLERDKVALISQQKDESAAMEQRFRAREEALLEDIARRERELREREAALRSAQMQHEADVQRRMQAREAELRAAHDATTKRMADQAAVEREKLSEGFMERLQQLSNAHMQQERELERMHREKEREMAQRYRLSGIETADRSEVRDRWTTEHSSAHLDVGKDALLKKFASVEERQRERAEKLRQTFSAAEKDPNATR